MKNINQEKYIEDVKEIVNLKLLQHKNANAMFNVYQDKLSVLKTNMFLTGFYQRKSKN